MRYQLVECNGEEKFFNTREEILQYMMKNYIEDEDILDRDDLLEEYKEDLISLDIESSVALTIYQEGYIHDSVHVYDTDRERYNSQPIVYMKSIEYCSKEELINLRNAIDERLKSI